MEYTLDDNLVASFIDDNLTPLERLVYSDSLKNDIINEIIEISKDVKSLESRFCELDPIRIPECESYIEKIYYQEIPTNVEDKPKNKLF